MVATVRGHQGAPPWLFYTVAILLAWAQGAFGARGLSWQVAVQPKSSAVSTEALGALLSFMDAGPQKPAAPASPPPPFAPELLNAPRPPGFVQPQDIAAGAAAPATAAAGRPLPKPCQNVRVLFAFAAAETDPKTNATVLKGNVTVSNVGKWVIPFERVGVRLCSRETDGHLRETAVCADHDVLGGEAVVCTWSVTLPAAPKVGSKVSDWTGLLSSVQLSLSGERCLSPIANPATGLSDGGSCSASGDNF